MKTKPASPVSAVDHVVTIRTFAISLPAPLKRQAILAQSQEMSSTRPSDTDSQACASSGVVSPQKTTLNQPIQCRRPSTVYINVALPQSTTHVGTRGTATSSSTVARRCYIDTSKHPKTNKSAFTKIKFPKQLLGVPGKIPERPKAVPPGSSAPSTALKTTYNRLKVPKKASITSSTTQSKSCAAAQSVEKLRSTSSLKRKHSDVESVDITSTNASRRLTKTSENGTKRRRQSVDTILACPNWEQYDDGVKAFQHLVMCRSSRSREPSLLSNRLNVSQRQ